LPCTCNEIYEKIKSGELKWWIKIYLKN
jgi:hypothetical protein